MSWELGSYLMAGAFTFGAAMALRSGNHVRVQLLLRRSSSDRRRVLEVAASLVALAFVAFLTWATVNLALTSYRLGEKSLAGGIPLWIPQSVIALGFSLLCLQLLARAVRAVLHLPLEEIPFDSEDIISRK
jgi:TRAP-type C4-dicarboxylate transport system permease small subunit